MGGMENANVTRAGCPIHDGFIVMGGMENANVTRAFQGATKSSASFGHPPTPEGHGFSRATNQPAPKESSALPMAGVKPQA